MADSGVDDEYDHLTLEDKIRRMFCFDKKDKLVSTIKKQLVRNGKFSFRGRSPSYLLKLASLYLSIKCATALLQGEAGIPLDVNVADEDGSFPLHCAADGWSLPLINLYLQHGAEIDVRCAPHHRCFGGMLPLNAALATFRVHNFLRDWAPKQSLWDCRIHHYLRGWTPKQSIFMLIIRLCLPEMRKGLDVVKFLAWNTKGAQEEIYHYAKKGEIMQLTVLLMVAREKFNAPFAFLSHDGPKLYQGLTLRQVIADEIALLMDEDVRNIAGGKGHSLTGISKDKKKLMKAALLLLEVFERAGDAIDAYLQLERTNVPVQQVANEVASLLQEAGFVLKHQDIDLSDINCFSSLDKLHNIVITRVPKFRPKYLDMRLSTQPCSFQPYRNNEDKSQNMTTLAHEVSNPKHGADANLRCDDTGLKFSGLLPLEVALKTLSCHQFLNDWSPKKSIYKLLFILCRPEMKEPLDAIRVLALKTKEVEEIIFRHAKKGDLIELAALLMVAQEKVMAQNNDGSSLDGTMRIRQAIIHETTSLDDEDFGSSEGSQCSKLARMYKDKGALMSSVLLLLEVFETAGLAIEEYIQYRSMHVPPEWVPKEVTWMLSHVGFKLKEKDIVMNDIKCFSPKLGPPQSEELKECRSLVKKFPMPLKSQQGGVFFAKSVCGMPNQQQRHPVSSPVSRSYHTFQIPKPSCGSRYVATLEAEAKKTTKASQHCVSHLPSNKQWASFAFAIMRGLRRL